ncbi:Putative tRNA pseudouridine synthase 2-like Protein [Gryllus bimaculatus]|nr:Putative tRNA pseudouridine synthase 2-like Protein [Gryllus bimaculatus]
MRYVSEAPVIWKLLNGVICVYKPQGMTSRALRQTLIGNIANDLNEFECRPRNNHVFSRNSSESQVVVGQSFADDPLVVGPRYLPNDVRCSWASHVGRRTSGVFVFGINKGSVLANHLRNARPIRVYHVTGKMGIATDTYDTYGAVVERSTFHHVKHTIMDRVLASIQAAHQKTMFNRMGVHMHSQAAYELAVKGTVRPPDGKIPFIYSIKCIEFDPPDFTIEVKCVNEHESYLKTLIHDIGMKVHSTAACSSIRCVRYGPFSIEHALLRRHWHLQCIFDNLSLCRRILHENRILMCDTPSSLIENDEKKLLECSKS